MNLMIHAVVILTMVSFCMGLGSIVVPNTITKFRMYLTNVVEDNVIVNISGKGGDYQGKRTLAFNEEFDWIIRAKVKTIYNVQRCYWLVRSDGLYVSKHNHTFPDDWDKKAAW
ncbi:unnamed protein product [Lactuca saligna]|uniref:S-protein homolog n=1 Tax=Lactuca saligna TaxID=75948 RepID=A0AA35Z8V5_LACSI|nr:unnamed protein product [Lactuca saligna]